MRNTNLLLATIPMAFCHPDREPVSEWVPAGPTDSRGPCPGLNMLANHGYLPHDGRNINPQMIAAAADKILNWDPPVSLFLASTAINKQLGVESIDLEDLNTPNVTEHRASLTRLDATEGDSLHLNPARLEALLADSDTDYLDIASLGRSRARVEALSPPPLEGSVLTQANAEAVAILVALPDKSDWTLEEFPTELRARKDDVRVFFTEGRFPDGWETPEHRVTLQDLGVLPAAVDEAKRGEAGKLV